jgi:hypothetical protein
MGAPLEATATMAADAIALDDDPGFDAELFARDPVFTRAYQKRLREFADDMDRRMEALRDAQIDYGPC